MSVKKQTGITMVEVLIALVVFAIGVGGMAGLQLRSLGMSVDATQRSVVLAKSQELADRIRANSAAIPWYLSVDDSPYSNANNTYCPNIPALSCADSSAGPASTCDGAQMATYDLWDVFCRSGTGLNDSVVDWIVTVQCSSVTCTSALDTVTITTSWVSKAADSDDQLAQTSGNNSDATIDTLSLSFIP